MCAQNVSSDKFNDTLSPQAQGRFVVGQVLDSRFEILEFVGQGGMSQVYRARHLNLNKDVAIKILSGSHGPDSLQRFAREAKVISKFDHPNLVKIYAFVLSEGAPYLVIDFLQGRSLKEILSGQPLEFERALNILSGVTRGLIHAHQNGVIHRDLKASNIIIVEEDGAEVAKIVDFGIAKCQTEMGQKLTRTDVIVGTPAYMSPEQCSGQTVDARSDLYSLGCVFYETLSGTIPFDRESAFELAMAHLGDEPPSLPTSVPRWLSGLTMQLLAKNPTDRVQTAQDVLNALEKRVFSEVAPTAFKKSTKMVGGAKPFAVLAFLLVLGISFALVLGIVPLPVQQPRSFEIVMSEAERKVKDMETNPDAVVEVLSLLKESDGYLRGMDSETQLRRRRHRLQRQQPQPEPEPAAPLKPQNFNEVKPRVLRMVALVNQLSKNPAVPESQRSLWLIQTAKHLDWLNERSQRNRLPAEEALEIANHSTACWQRAFLLYKPQAGILFERSENFHELPESYLRLGARLVGMQRYDEGIKAFESAEEHDSHMRRGSIYHFRTSALIMDTYHNLGQHAKANQWAERLEGDFLNGQELQVGNGDPGKKFCLASAHVRLARHYDLKHDDDSVLRHANKVIELCHSINHPEAVQITIEALCLKGRVLTSQHKWDRAQKVLDSAFKHARVYHLPQFETASNALREQLTSARNAKK